MSNIDLSSYSKEELIDVLRILKNYRTSLKQIGSRAEIIDFRNPKNKNFRIEYTSSSDKNFVEKFVDVACKKYFPDAWSDSKKEFVVNDKIIWGVRIFYGDDILDLSFQNAIANLI